MVVSCSACSEQYGVTEDVTFHKFPANKERREKWLAAVQRDDWTPAKRSMLCSKHFSPDKFIYKISRDKIRRYLMPDTVPTIFDRTKRKSKNGPMPRLGVNKQPSNSVLTAPASPTPVDLGIIPSQNKDTMLNDAADSTRSLNLEILAATSVASEPYLISINPESTQDADVASESVKTSAEILSPVADTDLTKSQKNRLRSFPMSNKRTYREICVQTDLTSFPKSPRQVYPGDFKQTEVSKSWTVQSNYIKKMRTSMKALGQRNRRLEKRVKELKSVVKFLKNRFVARDSIAVELCGHSDLPPTSHSVFDEDQPRRFPNPLRDHDYTFVKEKSTS